MTLIYKYLHKIFITYVLVTIIILVSSNILLGQTYPEIEKKIVPEFFTESADGIERIGLNSTTQNVSIDRISLNEKLSGLATKNIMIDNLNRFWIETEHGFDIFTGNKVVSYDPPSFQHLHKDYNQSEILDFVNKDSIVQLHYIHDLEHYDQWSENSRTFTQRNYVYSALENPLFKYNCVDNNDDVWYIQQNSDTLLIELQNSSISQSIYRLTKNNSIDTIDKIVRNTTGFWIIDIKENIFYLNTDGEITKIEAPAINPKKNIPKKKIQIDYGFHVDSSNILWYNYKQNKDVFKVDLNKGNRARLVNELSTDKMLVHIWEDESGNKIFSYSNRFRLIQRHILLDENDHATNLPVLCELSEIPFGCYSSNFKKVIYYYTHVGIYIINFPPEFISSSFVKPNVFGTKYGRIILGIDELPNNTMLFVDESSQLFSINEQTKEETHQYLFEEVKCGYSPKYDNINKQVWLVICSPKPDEQKLLRFSADRKTKEIYVFPEAVKHFSIIDDQSLFVITLSDNKHSSIYKLNWKTKERTKINTIENDLFNKSNISYHIYNKHTSELWLCSYNTGLIKIKIQNDSIVNEQQMQIEGFPTRDVLSIKEIPGKYYLVGTYDGLYKLTLDGLRILEHISVETGLTSNVVAAAEIDDYNNMWISTFSGLNVYDSLNQTYGYFEKSDGLPHAEFNRNASHKSNLSSNLFFGSANGVVKINPKKYIQNGANYKIFMGHLTYEDDKTTNTVYQIPKEPINIHISENSGLTCHFSANDWGVDNSGIFHYKIEGLNNVWRTTKERYITIDRLPEGEYKLHVRAISKYGYSTSNELIIPIEFSRKFYEQAWFRAFLFSLLFIAIMIGVMYNRQQAAIKKENTKRRIADLELNLLQSQMNPHFIFNALGSIQYYIHMNKKDIADEFLSKFAGLMRMFLESSRNKTITLKEEIKLLRLYTELEQLRFNDRLVVEFDIDIAHSQTNYQLPSMFIQPFVENAINHGLFHLKGQGKLLIQIFDKGNDLHFIIDDNGVGRKKAQEIKEASIRKHKSRSTQITQERLSILRDEQKLNIRINYTDYAIETHDRTGTKVEIIIPELK